MYREVEQVRSVVLGSLLVRDVGSLLILGEQPTFSTAPFLSLYLLPALARKCREIFLFQILDDNLINQYFD